MFVGGEFYYDERWLMDTPAISTRGMVFLSGGRACLAVIGAYLRGYGIHRILLPSYLCPNIVITFERCGLACDFYQVREDLSIDLEDLARKAEGHKAVCFINYFGFSHAAATLEFMRDLQQKGVIVVEDNAQAGFSSHHTGDFVLNSLRKFSPYDGGYLITRHDVQPYLENGVRANRRLPVIREYRQRLPDYLFKGEGNHAGLEELFTRAEQIYDTEIFIPGDEQERQQIERLDWAGIRQKRRENYRYLLSLLPLAPQVSAIFPELQEDNMPLGLPVYFNGIARDPVYAGLENQAIGLTIHWDDLRRHPRTCNNPLAVDMASRMLTLPVDQKTSHKQMDYLIQTLLQTMEKLS